MLVGQAVVAGTVGGGALELACEQHAHAMLCSGEVVREHQIVLGGANVSQCCGGRVAVRLEVLTPEFCTELEDLLARQRNPRVSLFLLGAAPCGRPRALALAPLPLRLARLAHSPH